MSFKKFFNRLLAGQGLEPSRREASCSNFMRTTETASGGRGSEIFYDGELCEPEIKYPRE